MMAIDYRSDVGTERRLSRLERHLWLWRVLAIALGAVVILGLWLIFQAMPLITWH